MGICLPALIVLFLDRVTKLIVTEHLALGESVPVVEEVFHWTYVMNPGAAFGMLPGQRWIFIGIALAVLGAGFFFRREILREGFLVQIGVGCFGAGALGNLVDRILWGAVIDFIDLRFWPVFNVADMGVCIGVALLFGSIVWKKES